MIHQPSTLDHQPSLRLELRQRVPEHKRRAVSPRFWRGLMRDLAMICREFHSADARRLACKCRDRALALERGQA